MNLSSRISPIDFPIVVSPSIAPINFKYYEAVKNIPIVIVDDSDGKVPREKPPEDFFDVMYKSRENVEEYVPKDKVRLFPQHNPSCKNFGLYYAYKEGFTTAILLDDDVDTSVNPNFLEQVPIGREVYAASVVTPYLWWNPMVQLGKPEFFSRGFPYEYRKLSPTVGEQLRIVVPKFNEGLWMGVPDINGVDKLGHEPEEYAPNPDCNPPYIHTSEYVKVPISIMNIQIARELIPAFYQPPDFDVAPGWKIRRHDDVWSGLFLQYLMGKKGDYMTVGQPMAYHRKAGVIHKEILSENCTNLIQPYLVQILKKAIAEVSESSYIDMAIQLSEAATKIIEQQRIKVPGTFISILAQYFNLTRSWAMMFIDI